MPKTNNSNNVLDSTLAIKALSDAGFSIEECYQIVKGREPSKTQKYAMQRKCTELSLAEPERVDSAITALDTIMKGEKIGQVKTVSTSDILAAIRMVIDRHEPVVSMNQNLNVSVELSPVNLDKYRVEQPTDKPE